MNADDDRPTYAMLSHYSTMRSRELQPILADFIRATDELGAYLCEITLMIGKAPPTCDRERTVRDLMADTFDFLLEARPLIEKGKVEVAYPLARAIG